MTEEIDVRIRKITTSSFAACERCNWTGTSKRNVLNEVRDHVLRVHLTEAQSVYPGENPYDAAMWLAVEIGYINSVKKWEISDSQERALAHSFEAYHTARSIAAGDGEDEDE